MAKYVPTGKPRGRPRSNRRESEFPQIDIRELFRAHPHLRGQTEIALSCDGSPVRVGVKYTKHAPSIPLLPWFVCGRCGRGARVLFVHTAPAVRVCFPDGRTWDAPTCSGLACRHCAKVDPESHNLTGMRRSLRRSVKLREQLQGGSPALKPLGMHWATHARLCRELRREQQMRAELTELRATGIDRRGAERSAARATGTDNPAELSNRELVRALRAISSRR